MTDKPEIARLAEEIFHGLGLLVIIFIGSSFFVFSLLFLMAAPLWSVREFLCITIMTASVTFLSYTMPAFLPFISAQQMREHIRFFVLQSFFCFLFLLMVDVMYKLQIIEKIFGRLG